MVNAIIFLMVDFSIPAELFLAGFFVFFKAKYKIKDIVCISLFKKSNKLVVYFLEQSYTVIVIDENLYDDFVLSLRKVNQEIIYDTRIDGEDTSS